ncbi:MAG: hypothetical protein R2764_02285 [Bacteroidales bacterium]
MWAKINSTPFEIVSGQELIISLWVDENNLNHIMAGGEYSGGLWKQLMAGILGITFQKMNQ